MKLISSKIVTIILLALLCFSTGCTKNHRVLINPSIPVHSSKIGNRVPVGVKVIDTRSSNIISKWQGGFKVRKFTVTSQGDLKDIFTTRIRQGLTKLGFLPKKFNPAIKRSLKIEILGIKSRYQIAHPKINIRVKVVLRVTCMNQRKRFSKSFTSRKSRNGISPASFPNESLLNDTISETMGTIFSDSSLITCLTGNSQLSRT